MSLTNTLVIDGVDFSSDLQWQGIKWASNDLDSEDSGRQTRDGLMHRSIVARKVKLEITLMPMDDKQIKKLLDILTGKTYLTVKYTDPKEGTVTKICYNSSRQATIRKINKTSGPVWEDISFALTER